MKKSIFAAISICVFLLALNVHAAESKELKALKSYLNYVEKNIRNFSGITTYNSIWHDDRDLPMFRFRAAGQLFGKYPQVREQLFRIYEKTPYFFRNVVAEVLTERLSDFTLTEKILLGSEAPADREYWPFEKLGKEVREMSLDRMSREEVNEVLTLLGSPVGRVDQFVLNMIFRAEKMTPEILKALERELIAKMKWNKENPQYFDAPSRIGRIFDFFIAREFQLTPGLRTIVEKISEEFSFKEIRDQAKSLLKPSCRGLL